MAEYSFDRGEFRYDPRDAMIEAMLRDREELMRIDRMRPAREPPRRSRDEIVREVINDPEISLSSAEKRAINDDTRVMDSSGSIRTLTRTEQVGPRRILYPPINEVTRTRKKNGNDKKMAKALRMANERLRTTNGRLRKGKSQSDIMRLAHRLRRRM